MADDMPGSRLPTQQQQDKAKTSWQGKATGITGGGMTRLSPGVYRNPQGGLTQSPQRPTTQVPAAKPAPKPKTVTPPGQTPIGTTPSAPTPPMTPPPADQTQAALAGYQGYRLPTQEELTQMFQKRYEQELADITFGAGERQARERASREQQLANMGISIDSEAYRNEQRALAESQALEAAQARQQARQFAEGAIGAEFARATQAQQLGFAGQRAALEQRQFEEGMRQFDKNYALQNKQLVASIRNDKNLTKIQRDTLTEQIRSGKAMEALKAQEIAAMRKGDADKASQAADAQAKLWEAKRLYLIEQLGMDTEKANKILEKELRGGNTGYTLTSQ